jgi:hypothetical protein
MFGTHTTYIGIDPTAGHKPFVYVALDQDLRLLALGKGSIDEVSAFVGGQRQAYAAVNGPPRPNQKVMERAEVREKLVPPPRPGRWTNFRLAEYQLRLHNISCPKTPAVLAECPNWMQMGFAFYHRLESMGYKGYPGSEAALQWLEIYPHASYCTLLGLTPFPKYTLEGRLQRQLVLFDRKLHVPDPMNFFEEITRHRLVQGILPTKDLYSSEELDAMVAAYTAWLAANQPDQVTLIGDPQEGQIVLPVAELKRKY